MAANSAATGVTATCCSTASPTTPGGACAKRLDEPVDDLADAQEPLCCRQPTRRPDLPGARRGRQGRRTPPRPASTCGWPGVRLPRFAEEHYTFPAGEPSAGALIGIFNWSYYEDVIVVRAHLRSSTGRPYRAPRRLEAALRRHQRFGAPPGPQRHHGRVLLNVSKDDSAAGLPGRGPTPSPKFRRRSCRARPLGRVHRGVRGCADHDLDGPYAPGMSSWLDYKYAAWRFGRVTVAAIRASTSPSDGLLQKLEGGLAARRAQLLAEV